LLVQKNAREFTLILRQNGFKRMIPLDSASNVVIVRTVPKFMTYKSFCADVAGVRMPINESELLMMRDNPAAIVTNNELRVNSEEDADAVTGRMQPD